MLRAEGVRAFFQYARRRHEIYLRRAAGHPPPWTNEAILQQYRFTNVFRELDRTTIWCREHVRERYEGLPEVLPAVVVFRWFNKIETGEAIFGEEFDWWLREGDIDYLRRAIKHARGDGPYVNGAYVIRSPTGMSKLDGVLQCCERFRTRTVAMANWREAARGMVEDRWTLRQAWEWLMEHELLGEFMAYEIVSDLRHTHLLRGASDIMTWANPGPGATRGLNRVQGRPVGYSTGHRILIPEMQEMLLQSSRSLYWPQDWPAWEMREVEHTLCEFDKYERARTGEGTPKQRYDGWRQVQGSAGHR